MVVLAADVVVAAAEAATVAAVLEVAERDAVAVLPVVGLAVEACVVAALKV